MNGPADPWKFKMAAAAILNFSKRNHVGAKHQNPDENIGPELYISSEKPPSPQNAYQTIGWIQDY